MWNTVKWSMAALIVALAITLAGVVGYAVNDGSDSAPGPDGGSTQVSEDYAILDEITEILKEDFVNPEAIDEDLLQYGSIQGLIDALGDPHTEYIPPEQYAGGIDIISGSFEGIGATVDLDPVTGEIVIVQPFRGSPAEEAGLNPGDAILAVDGESTEGWSTRQAVTVIRGEQGTPVVLTVRHAATGEIEDVEIIRKTIVIPTVFSQAVADENGETVEDLAYVNIQQFTDQTVPDLEAELERIQDEGYEGVIIDLRNNPGGGLDATVRVADLFLDDGIILTQVERDGSETVYEAHSGGPATELPVVLLVNSFSASGSEVLAGALRDHDRATIIGEQTFGKGSVNHVRPLSNGGALYVTIARWLTPNGELIEGVGLAPDVAVVLTPEDLEAGNDTQLYAAIDFLHDEIAKSLP
jgi:carboxyl-terminal processing protease